MIQGVLGGDAAGGVEGQQPRQQVVPRVRQGPRLLVQRRRRRELVPQLVVRLLGEGDLRGAARTGALLRTFLASSSALSCIKQALAGERSSGADTFSGLMMRCRPCTSQSMVARLWGCATRAGPAGSAAAALAECSLALDVRCEGGGAPTYCFIKSTRVTLTRKLLRRKRGSWQSYR